MSTDDQEIELTRSTEFHHLFSNHSRVRVGQGEIGITFSYKENISDVPYVTDLINVTITPSHAKYFIIVLTEILNQYEAKTGEIIVRNIDPIDIELVMKNVRVILDG